MHILLKKLRQKSYHIAQFSFVRSFVSLRFSSPLTSHLFQMGTLYNQRICNSCGFLYCHLIDCFYHFYLHLLCVCSVHCTLHTSTELKFAFLSCSISFIRCNLCQLDGIFGIAFKSIVSTVQVCHIHFTRLVQCIDK